MSDLSPAHVADLASDLRQRGLAAHTIKNALLNVLSSLWNAAKRDGLVAGRLLADVRIEAPRRAWQPFTDDERERILAHFAARSRDEHVLVACVFLAGMRPSEAAALRWREVDLTAGRVTIRWTAGSTTAPGSKVHHARLIVAPLRLLEILRSARPGARKGDLIATRRGARGPIDAKQWGSDVWASALRALGITPRRFSDARYSFIASRAAQGVDLEQLAAYCGSAVEALEHALGKRRSGRARG